MPTTYVEVEVEFQHETDNAWLVVELPIQSKRVEHWIPKSQIKYRRQDANKQGVIQIPKWLADKKNLDYEEA